jgi:GcrA cell cycle regulator
MIRIDAIAKLWTQGRSLTEIGLALGLSRGAVAGEINRARLRRDPRFLKFRLSPFAKPPLPPRVLVDLRLHDCRWAVGLTPDDLHLFCGQPQAAGSPYCAKHRDRAQRG